MVFFSSGNIRTDITVLKFFENVILAGIQYLKQITPKYQYLIIAGVGDFLYVFDKIKYQYLHKFKIFDGQKIYGIFPNLSNRKCILFSGGTLKLINFSDGFEKIDDFVTKATSDWILDATWINNETFSTVSMHNKIQIWSSTLHIEFQQECDDKCMLYSAHLYSEGENLFVFSGTVFSEVLIWSGKHTVDGRCLVLKRLAGHKGVIFSINYNSSVGKLCSTSDDRSTFLWFLDRNVLENIHENQEVPCIQVHGHASRIFRCRVLKNLFITGGEDSILNLWSHQGKLQRKIETHHGGSIWALDCDEDNNCIVIGGGDGGISVFPITFHYSEEKVNLDNFEKPKLVGILSSSNLVAISENGILYYFNCSERQWHKINQFEDMKNYILLQISKCRKLVALAGFHGQIYIYKEDEDSLRLLTQFQTKLKSRIFSFHWITCNSFLICQNGVLTLFFCENDILNPISTFILPVSKERWTTCGILVNNNIIVGDRKGNIHLFQIGNLMPLQTLKRVHSFLGVTNLIKTKDNIISLGRDGLIKTFTIKDKLMMITSDKLPFSWLLNTIDNFLLAFTSSNFLVWDQRTKRILLEIPCGGGHRCWDLNMINNNLMFIYIKDKVVNIARIDIQGLIPKDLITGFHVYEVNSIEVLEFSKGYILISGGEDTTLRITSLIDSAIESKLVLKSHLSSIRTITSYDISEQCSENIHSFLIFSAGGRAQIICWKLNVNKELNVICKEEYSYYESLRNDESEVRVMDLFVTKMYSRLILCSACSDGNIKVFTIENKNGQYSLELFTSIFHKLRCIMKIHYFVIFGKFILVSMATDGYLTFWDISDIFNAVDIQPFGSIKIHQSGINSYTSKVLDNNKLIFLTGGDDNAVVLTFVMFELNENNKITLKVMSNFTDVGTHCAQITGLHLTAEYFLSTGIDQRIALFWWKIHSQTVNCRLILKYNTPISDIKGLKCFEKSNRWDIIVFGNGLEFLTMKK